MEENTLKIAHFESAGFFSHCSVRLSRIVDYFNRNNKPPFLVDSSAQFGKYKTSTEDAGDISSFFFEKKDAFSSFAYSSFNHDAQFYKYKDLEFDILKKYIDFYFYPSQDVRAIINELEIKYEIDYENTCSVFYRGNDKSGEINLPTYKDFFEKINQILLLNRNIRFLIQTDELEFLEAFKRKYTNSFYFSEIPLINHNEGLSVDSCLPNFKRKIKAARFLAATIIVSKCSHLITHSGNCGLWAALYRGNAYNLHQHIHNLADKNFEKYIGWVE